MANETEKKKIRIVRKEDKDPLRIISELGKEKIVSSSQKISVERPSTLDTQLLSVIPTEDEDVIDQYFLEDVDVARARATIACNHHCVHFSLCLRCQLCQRLSEWSWRSFTAAFTL